MTSNSPTNRSVRPEHIASAMVAGDFDRAAELADTAIARGLIHPIAHKARALAFQEKGLFENALAEYERARDLQPKDANVSNAIGICLLNLNRPLEAIKAFEAAIAVDARFVQAYFRIGWTLEMLGETAEAEAQYRTAVGIDPRHADSLASLAGLAAAAGRSDEARVLAEKALLIDANQPTAIAALGRIALANGRHAEAEQCLRKVLGNANLTLRARSTVEGLLGDALDAQGKTGEAFACFSREKAGLRKLYAPSFASQPNPLRAGEIVASLMQSASTWPAPPEFRDTTVRGHVFLAGFFGTGSTALADMLAAGDEVAVLNENDILADIADACLTSEDGFASLAALTEDEIGERRAEYWRSIRAALPVLENKVLIDKCTLNTLKLPLIARLFPESRIIVAIRDPRDALLSCVRRHFEVNAATFELLTLEGIAKYLATTLEVTELFRRGFSATVQFERYEDFASDFEAALARMCEVVAISPTSAMNNFRRRFAPDGRESRPLHEVEVGAWRRYRDRLSPVLTILAPWIEKFGYPRD